MNCMLRREKIFCEDTSQYTNMITCDRRIWSRCVLIHDSTEIVHTIVFVNTILTVINVLNKHTWVVPLKAKSGNEMTKAIAKIIRDNGRCPKNLHTDKGKEFFNSDVQKFLNKHNINHYSVMKASVVERFKNNTLKNDM